MNELKIFTKEEFGQVRTVLINDDVWFIGRDIVEALGYDIENISYSKYIKNYCDEADYVLVDKETQVQNRPELNYRDLGQRGGYILNESGMYSLIFNSKLPQAKDFKNWVTKEILPSIRKHGMYATENTLDNMLNNPDFAIKLFTQLKQEREEKAQLVLRNKDLEHTVEYKNEIITGLTENIDVYKKRDIVNRIIKRKAKDGKGYAGRYKEMYQCYKEVFHIDLIARCEGYNLKMTKSKDKLSIIKYAEMFNHIDGLYEIACKLYESEVERLLEELR